MLYMYDLSTMHKIDFSEVKRKRKQIMVPVLTVVNDDCNVFMSEVDRVD